MPTRPLSTHSPPPPSSPSPPTPSPLPCLTRPSSNADRTSSKSGRNPVKRARSSGRSCSSCRRATGAQPGSDGDETKPQIGERGRSTKRARAAGTLVGTLAALSWLPATVAGPVAVETPSFDNGVATSFPSTFSSHATTPTPSRSRIDLVAPSHTSTSSLSHPPPSPPPSELSELLDGLPQNPFLPPAAFPTSTPTSPILSPPDRLRKRATASHSTAVACPSASGVAGRAAASALSSCLYYGPASSSTSISSPTHTATSTPTLAEFDTAASATSVNIPDGWQAKTRETEYYAVPIIISMSILVAIMVIGTVFGTVFCRRKKRRRSRRKSGVVDEKGWGRRMAEKVAPKLALRVKSSAPRTAPPAAGGDGTGNGRAVAGNEGGENGGSGSSGGRRRVRTTGFAAGPRVRPRRRRRNAEGEEDDDEGTALTRTSTHSSSSSVVRDTLTARLSARMRGDRPRPPSAPTRPSTVFSRSVDPRSTVSLTASALSRITSSGTGALQRSSSSPTTPTSPSAPELLFTPADDPSLQEQPHIPGSPSLSLSRSISHSSPLHLTRSRTSSLSSIVPALPLPASALPLALHSAPSTFGALVATDALPVPGPPAYRAASSTVQATRRFGAGDAVSSSCAAGAAAPSVGAVRGVIGRAARMGSRRSVGRSRGEAGQEQDNEGEWHWPGEKGRAFASYVGANGAEPSGSTLSSTSGHGVEEGRFEEDEAEEEEAASPVDPPVDRSLFSAHIATDDKAVLARLRARNDRRHRVNEDAEVDEELVVEAGGSSRPAPTAPPAEHLDDEHDVDEDGFERLPATLDPSSTSSFASSSASRSATPTASTSSSALPAPPTRLQYFYLSHSTLPSAPSAAVPDAPLPSASMEKSALAVEYAAAGLADDGEEGEEDGGEHAHGEGWLPRYGGAPIASAPPALDDDEEEEEEDAMEDDEAPAQSTSGREEHAEV